MAFNRSLHVIIIRIMNDSLVGKPFDGTPLDAFYGLII